LRVKDNLKRIIGRSMDKREEITVKIVKLLRGYGLSMNDAHDIAGVMFALLTPPIVADNDEHELRQLLWLHHGCDVSKLYGDDGEMKCPVCMIDFKRDSVADIQAVWTKRGMDALKAVAGIPYEIVADLAEQVGRLRNKCPKYKPYPNGECMWKPGEYSENIYPKHCHPHIEKGCDCNTGLVPLDPDDRVDLVGMVKVLPECLDELKGMHHLGDCDCPACETVRRAENVLNGLRVEADHE